MSMYRNCWGFCLVAGVGVAVGALAVLSLTRGNKSDLRKTCVSLLSHGLDLGEKAAVAAETVKESLEDFTAEARYEADARKMNVLEEDAHEVGDTVKRAQPVAKKAVSAKKAVAKRVPRKSAAKPA